MARKGGQTTFSGTKFQAEITLLYLGRLLDPRPRVEEDQVKEVRPEADVEAEVDDILVRFGDGHREYIQAKEKLAKSQSETSAWVKMWKHFADQRWGKDFGLGDRIVLALGVPQAWTDDLRSACESASESARDSREWYAKWLNKSQARLVAEVRQILFELDDKTDTASEPLNQQDDRLFELFASLTVRLYDPERMRRDEGPRFMPESERGWSGLYDLLLRIVWESAEKGKAIESGWLQEEISKEGVKIYAPAEIPGMARPLTNPEIQAGLIALGKQLTVRAPALMSEYQTLANTLTRLLGVNPEALSPASQAERQAALSKADELSSEALDLSFQALGRGQEPPAYDARCPFRGLYAFSPQDRQFFFGREELVASLLGRLKAHNFLAVLGPSGCGKSSLVLAGLAPRLGTRLASFVPGEEPLAALQSALSATPQPDLLVVDQFEELFTLCSDRAKREAFSEHLLGLAGDFPVVITMRADFWGECAPYQALKEAMLAHQELVAPLGADELLAASEQQAQVVGLRFEPGLAQRILNEVEGEPGAMPLLQHALLLLWERRHGRWLKYAEYADFGGVGEAIADTAEKSYGSLSDFERQRVQDIFTRLTRLDDSEGEAPRHTRRRVRLGELVPAGSDPTATAALVKRLADARLVATSLKAGTEEKFVEVAHEALIGRWPRLMGWLRDDQASLRLREGIRQAALEWEAADQDEALLVHRGGRLEETETLAEAGSLPLNQTELDYLRACVERRQRERHAREQRARRTVVAAIAVAIIMAVLGLWGFVNARLANEQAQLAVGRQLAAQAQMLLSGSSLPATNITRSALLAVEAGRRAPGLEADQALRRALHFTPFELARMQHDGPVSSVAFSPDGELAISGGWDGSARVWEARTGTELARLGHDDYVTSVAFSPDGQLAISGSVDGSARVWEARTGTELARLGHDNTVWSVAFSPDGALAISGSGDGSARVWEARTGTEIARMQHDDTVWSVAFSRDGELAISGGWDGSARVWEARTSAELARMQHDSAVTSVSFSPDGELAISGGGDGNARVWEARTGTELARMQHDSAVSSVAFSPDGRLAVSGSDDLSIRVWEARSGVEITRLLHDSTVTCVAFSPDGDLVISGDANGNARVLEVVSGKEISRMQHFGYIDSVAFNPDGSLAISGGFDGSARVWELTSGGEIMHLQHDGSVNSVAFSPDGVLAISGGNDSIAHVWNVISGEETARMQHDGPITSVALSLDSRLALSGSFDRSAKVWDAHKGEEVSRIQNEAQVLAVAFSPDGRLVVSGGAEGKVQLWDSNSGIEIASKQHGDWITSVAFSPDGKQILIGSADGSARIWEVQSNKEIISMQHDDWVTSVAFNLDGELVISGSDDGSARIWKVYSGEEVTRRQHDGWVYSVAFNPDGRMAVSGGSDGSAWVWEVISGEKVARMQHDGPVNSVAFSPDGKMVISGSTDGSARVWYWRIEDLIAEVCKRLPRNLTLEEWQQYLGEEPYRPTCPNLPVPEGGGG